MTNIFLDGHEFKYEIEDIISLFYDRNTFRYLDTKQEFNDLLKQETLYSTSLFPDAYIISELFYDEKASRIKATSKIFANSKMNGAIETTIVDFSDKIELKREAKRVVKLSVLKMLEALHNKTISWGVLTGIRPTKKVKELYSRGIKIADMPEVLHKKYGVSEHKSKLMIEIAQKEFPFLKKNDKNSVSVYLDIPFCPSRCLYCSFTSNPISKYKNMVMLYLEALRSEMKKAREIIDTNKWNLETIYIGGGTPTSLDEYEFEFLLNSINKVFNFNNLKEFTIEAGRPDTLNLDKLKLMKKYGATRISINPQTMNDYTLKVIGRRHTVKDVIDVYNLAREVGFDNINMDIIMGLPGENVSMFIDTLKGIKNLRPDSVTVHTLAIKKGSELIDKINEFSIERESEIEQMQDLSYNTILGMGLRPYYMYRQKNMVGGQENIGYSVSGKECIYNIKMIEEVQNIIALGAGAVSRVIDYENGTIEKVFNDRSVEGYISRIDEMIDKKSAFVL